MTKRSRLPLRGIRFPRFMALAPPGWKGYKPRPAIKRQWQQQAYKEATT